MYYILMNKNGLQFIDFLHEREDSYEAHTKYRKNESEPEYILASPRRSSFFLAVKRQQSSGCVMYWYADVFLT